MNKRNYFTIMLIWLFVYLLFAGCKGNSQDSLTELIEKADLQKIREMGKKIDQTPLLSNGYSPLTYAAALNSTETVKVMLDFEPDINAKDSFGMSAFDYVWDKQNTELLKLLLSKEVYLSSVLLKIYTMEDNKDIRDQKESFLIGQAGKDNFIKLILSEYEKKYEINKQYILDNIAYLNTGGNELENQPLFKELNILGIYLVKYHPLFEAMDSVNWGQIQKIVNEKEYSVYFLSFALRVAVNKNFQNTVSFLLERGADPNLPGIGTEGPDVFMGYSLPLFISIFKQNYNNAVLLMNKKANPDISLGFYREGKLRGNYNACLTAVLARFNYFVVYLINQDKEKYLNIFNDYGETPLFLSIETQNTDLTYFLLKNNAEIMIKVKYDMNNTDILPMHRAILNNDYTVVRWIVNKINDLDNSAFSEYPGICKINGITYTYLSLASFMNEYKICVFLINNGADKSLATYDVFMYAFQNENYSLVRYFYLIGMLDYLGIDEKNYILQIAKEKNKEYLLNPPEPNING